ncbi:uncharacterized protein LOC105697203 [Orussus abietinus]|uniref:uncharacterized protein LOC105697203 n=1 Tax=Orussus abietinus TaxID=222816 RepID=UPI0006262CA5|nr:uncharacterized protein LOC105697203 [Orussus abietinus]
MPWFFGRRKQKDSPPESGEEEPSSEQGDDFIFIEKKGNPMNSNTDNDESSGRLYPALGGAVSYPPPLPSNLFQQHQTEGVNYFSNVPFKLCKELQSSMNNDAAIDKLRVSEISSFIERIGNEDYSYDFFLEKSVINEMNSVSE